MRWWAEREREGWMTRALTLAMALAAKHNVERKGKDDM